jgi:hypothetical protein
MRRGSSRLRGPAEALRTTTNSARYPQCEVHGKVHEKEGERERERERERMCMCVCV